MTEIDLKELARLGARARLADTETMLGELFKLYPAAPHVGSIVSFPSHIPDST